MDFDFGDIPDMDPEFTREYPVNDWEETIGIDIDEEMDFDREDFPW